MQSSNSKFHELTQWLTEKKDVYSFGIPKKTNLLPWIFVVSDDSKSAIPILEAAITKGLKKQLGSQALIISPDEFYSKFNNRICFAEAMIWVGVHPHGSKSSSEDIESYQGVPFCWLSNVHDNEDSKRVLWNYLKELRFYVA